MGAPLVADRTPDRAEQQELARRVGERMREARELSNMAQIEAARRLGYANPSKLAKVEHAHGEATSVPLWLLVKAAGLYGVSVDFLMGTSDDTESDEPVQAASRAVLSLMRDVWESQRKRDVRAIVGALHRVAAIEADCATIARLARGADAALSRFAGMNSGFVDMPGGATLARAVPETAAAASRLCARLVRLRDDADRISG